MPITILMTASAPFAPADLANRARTVASRYRSGNAGRSRLSGSYLVGWRSCRAGVLQSSGFGKNVPTSFTALQTMGDVTFLLHQNTVGRTGDLRRNRMSSQAPTLGNVRRSMAPLWGSLLLAASITLPARADAPGWPRQFESSSGSFVVYQPEPEQLDGDHLNGRAAFAVEQGGSSPTFGVLWFTARIEIDRDSSTVTMRNLDVTKVRLPGITPEQESRYEGLIESEATHWDLSGSLAELQAGLASAEQERASVAGLDNTAPKIVFKYERTLLLLYDGPPFLEPIEGTRLQRVANTPYAVVFDPDQRTYYLNGANLWYSATDPLGPWSELAAPPAEVRSVVPPDTVSSDRVRGAAPRVLVATEPTELIAIDGPPSYAPLVGDDLLYVTNTESDVVREVG